MNISFMILLSLRLLWRNDFADASISVVVCMYFFSIFFFDNVANVHVVLTIYMMMLHKCNKD
jgi:hypothetical protein